MQEQYLFEYAVIRIVPMVEREEFINAGVVLYCSKQKFLGMKYKVDPLRLSALCKATEPVEIEKYLRAFEQICAGEKEGGSIGKLPIAERFRWLTATRSTVVQTSQVHPGFCDDAEKMLERLFQQLVC